MKKGAKHSSPENIRYQTEIMKINVREKNRTCLETWGTHPADEKGCEALSSRENTRNRSGIMRNQCSWKWTRTRLETCKHIRDDIWHHETSYNLNSRNHFSQDSRALGKIVADRHHQWSDSRPEVNTIGIYVGNHQGWCRNSSVGYDFIYEIWISRWPWHICARTPWFLKRVPWKSAPHHF